MSQALYMNSANKVILLFVMLTACVVLGGKDPLEDPRGVVPDAQTAIRIAEPILFRHFGEHEIKAEMPYIVKLENGIWKIGGTLPEGFLGGVFYIDIRQKDACVLRLGYPE
jgi:hypothetical protein